MRKKPPPDRHEIEVSVVTNAIAYSLVSERVGEYPPEMILDEEDVERYRVAADRAIKHLNEWRRSHRPEIVCLCGSTRFHGAFQEANYELTLAGHIVLTVGFYPRAVTDGHGEGVGHDSEEKVRLDELHKRKIDLADRVHVLNVGGYVGESTLSEIAYAETLGKPVTYLEEPDAR